MWQYRKLFKCIVQQIGDMLDHNQFKFLYGIAVGSLTPILKHIIRPNSPSNIPAMLVGRTLGAIIGDDVIIDPLMFGGPNVSDDAYVAAGTLASVAAVAGLKKLKLRDRLVNTFPRTAFMLGAIGSAELVTILRRKDPALHEVYRREEALEEQLWQ